MTYISYNTKKAEFLDASVCGFKIEVNIVRPPQIIKQSFSIICFFVYSSQEIANLLYAERDSLIEILVFICHSFNFQPNYINKKTCRFIPSECL